MNINLNSLTERILIKKKQPKFKKLLIIVLLKVLILVFP